VRKIDLAAAVAGLDTPTAGSLLTEGREIQAPDPSRVVVFQDPTAFPWRTVWSNVALGLEHAGCCATHRGRIEDALRLVGLTDSPMLTRTSFPAAWRNARLWRARWSTTQSLLILDEPLGQLDSLTRITMQGELVSLWQRAGFTAAARDPRCGRGVVPCRPGYRVEPAPSTHQGGNRERQAVSSPPGRPASGRAFAVRCSRISVSTPPGKDREGWVMAHFNSFAPDTDQPPNS